jgi:tRNA(His) 5'-end guanylyltransferase
MPVIIRLDGKAFHTMTRRCEKPFDDWFANSMVDTAVELCANIQGAKCAYIQSDEISILVTDFARLTSDAWFDYNLQKMVSVSAGIASAYFSKCFFYCQTKYATFDSRAFNVPKDEVCNYFIWRQQDWIRNSIHMLSQSYYSHKQLHKKNTKDMHEMLYEKGVNWADLAPKWKNGTFVFYDAMWMINDDVIFTKNRDSVERLLIPIEE